jgi:hypothetical protein
MNENTTIAHAEVDELLAELHTSVTPDVKSLMVLAWLTGKSSGFKVALDKITSPAVKPGAPDDIEALKDLAAIKP